MMITPRYWMVLLLALTACGTTMREMPTAAVMETGATELTQEYTIGPRDVLQVSVWKQPELTVPNLQVRLDGKISIPLLDDVHAAGLTPAELKADITERLAEYITAPHVTVVVREMNSKLVYIIGEVTKEGPMVLQAKMRVLDAIATAGGFKQFASKGRIKVLREREGAGPAEFLFDYSSFVAGKDLEQNILLLPGDRVVVPQETPFWTN